MRNFAQVLVLVALVGSLAAVITGILLLGQPAGRRSVDTERPVVERIIDSPPRAVHAVAGLVGTGAAGLLAAVGLLLGLHGVLEPRGRRLLPALLLLCSPILMGAALAMVLSGVAAARRGAVAGSTAFFTDVHALRITGVLLAALVVFGILSSLVVRRRSPSEREG